jgi:DNA polymerase-3 subunit delta
MTGTIDKAVAEIRSGKRHPVYLLHGDEFLARSGVKALVDALVPAAGQALSVETLEEDVDLASLPVRLNTLPLWGGTKVVLAYDTKAFVSKQTSGSVARRSLEAWEAGDRTRALRLFLQVVAAAGKAHDFLERAARGALMDAEWEEAFALPRDSDGEAWLGEVAAQAVTEAAAIPQMGGAARVYEDVLDRGIPPGVSLLLTAEVIDQRRALFKKISQGGLIIDCGVRSRRVGDTQMSAEAARATIRGLAKDFGKRLDEEALGAILERTGFSVRVLSSEMQKVCLYAGDRPHITRGDVLAVLSSSREAGIFDLTNALGERDAARALRALRGLLTQREPAVRILFTLASEVRNLLLARLALESRLEGKFDPKMPYPAFQSRILPRLTQEAEAADGAATLAGMNPFRAFNLLRGAARFSLEELVGALAGIQETDLSLKTSGHPPEWLLETLLIRVCGAAR